MQIKHEQSLQQKDDKGHGFVYNLMYKNILTTLNYFSLSILCEYFPIAILIA